MLNWRFTEQVDEPDLVRRWNPQIASLPIGVNDSPNGPKHHRSVLVFEKKLCWYFLQVRSGSPKHLGMAKPEVSRRDMSPIKQARGVVINEDAAVSREKASKLPTKGGKVSRPKPRA
uniref:Uncharacterized protein n=1 Tax=Solanum tuberosum TaxID=4113 RepID=M1DJ57_SOLTU